MSGGGYNDYNGMGEAAGNMMMSGVQDGMMDMPPFNPTDYFRDMIFMSDFMVEQEFNNGVDNNGFGGN